ncbi:MAG TPA: response regulator [Blastocatellia bacterium]|nr:response regulator [Blastocatellia bacterium]
MSKTRILLSDNDPVALASQKEFFESNGFQVFPTENREDAKKIHRRGMIDVAVLDVRLEHDDDERDYSGLELAEEVVQQTPTIIYSRLNDIESVRERIYPGASEFSPRLVFVNKKEELPVLLARVKKALALSSGSASSFFGLPPHVRSRIALILLLFALVAGIVATINTDPRWLFATVVLVILDVFFIGVAIE